MLFTAKVVEDRLAGKIMLSVAVVSISFILLGMFIPPLQDIVPLFIGAVLLVLVSMLIIYKGDLSSYQLTNDLQVYTDSMQINRLVFPFDEISELAFQFQSYQQDTDHLPTKNYQQRSYGLGNNLSFIYKNQTFHYQFFLQNRNHYLQFVNMLEHLYEQRVIFEEANLKGKTYLMQNMTEDQLAHVRRAYRL